MNRKENYIGVFDSGVGGISVLRQLMRRMPNERYLYFGDSINAPYGVRSVEEVRQLAMNTARHLVEQGVKALVVACGTATANAMDLLQETYPELIIVGTRPAVPQAVQLFPGGSVGVLATPRTLQAPKTLDMLEEYGKDCHLISLPAPGLADLVEAGKGVSPESEALLRQLLEEYRGKLDAVVLGCTHYPFAKSVIRKILGEGTAILDSAPIAAEEARQRLTQAGLLYDGPGELVMENSSPDPEMITLAKNLLGM